MTPLPPDFSIETCPTCGVTHAVPTVFQTARRADLKGFYCPNGHVANYRESTETRLTKKLEQLAASKDSQIDWLNRHCDQISSSRKMLRRRLAATQGVVTKLRKSVAKLVSR